MGNLGRQPLTIVEIDVDRCARTYGSSPCEAVLGTTGARKCFNSFKTCQDIAHYSKGALTLRFSHNSSGLPKGLTIFPALKSVSERPSEINLSGIDPKTNALGKRARVTVQLQDFVYHDSLTDKYQAERVSGAAQADGVGYDPSRGTFFGKWLARNPYYAGRALRVRRGYVGDDIPAMATTRYVISEWSGPDAAGSVTIVAKDILDLADNKKAVAPKASNGRLAYDIGASGDTARLVPSGIGNAEYPSTGRVCIGREVATFDRSGDILTLKTRGSDGTEASAHSEDDVVQVCLRYANERGSDIIADLEQNYAGVDPAYINLASWNSAADRWMGGIRFTRTITAPTGVATLIGQLCQHGMMHWWDAEEQQLKFRPNRPLDLGESYYPITDARNIIQGTVNSLEGDDQRVSAIFFYHSQIDPTDGEDDARNYTKLVIAADPSASSAREYNESRIKRIYSPWLTAGGNDAAALAIATRLVNRYRNTPRVISAALDVKDKAALELGGLVSVQSYLFQDATGLDAPQLMQVNYMEEKEDRLTIKAETYTFSGRYGFITGNSRGNYSGATSNEKKVGTYIVDDATLKFGDGTGPYLMY